jgi:hypothetical protein
MLQPSGLEKSQQLKMNKDILNSIYLLDVLDNVPVFFNYKLTNKIICTNWHTDTHKVVRAEVVKGKLSTKLSQ